MPRLAVLLVLASVLFWAVYAAGQHVPAPLCPALRRLAGWCYGVYLVHHVLLTLVFLPFVQGHGLPLAGMFPVYLAASFVPAAVLTAMSRPVSKAVKKIGIKNRTHSFSRLCVCFCIHKGRFCIRPYLSANGAASRAFSSYCRACKAASSGGMSCFLRLTTPGSLAMFPSGSTWNASRMISSALWP